MRKAPGIAAYTGQRAATRTRLARLSEDQWLWCAPTGRRVRDITTRLIAVDEAALNGRLAPTLLRARLPHDLERWAEDAALSWRDASPAALLDALERLGQRFCRRARLVPTVAGQVRVRGPYGRQPLLYLLYRRVLDEWVAERDIALATAAAAAGVIVAPPQREVADALAAAVLTALPMLALPRNTRTTGVVRLVVDSVPSAPDEPLPHEAVRRVWGVDFARRHYGPRVRAEADAVARTSAAVLALVHVGRLSWRALPNELLQIEGDQAVAADVLDTVAPAPRDR